MFYIALIFLGLSSLSFWVKKTPWIWVFFCILSLIFAERSGQLAAKAFIPLAMGTGLFWVLQWNVKGLSRFVIIGTALVLTGAIFACLAPGFPNCLTLFDTQVNYGKILIILPILGWLIPTLAVKADWIRFFKNYFVLTALGAFIILAVACYLYPPIFKPSFLLKTPSAISLWMITYLIASIIPEEVLLRGFLQKELFPFMGNGFMAHAITVIVSSSIFSFFHLTWITDIRLLGLVFLASSVYGVLYQITKMIETSIFCRTMTSFIYFFLLSKNGFL